MRSTVGEWRTMPPRKKPAPKPVATRVPEEAPPVAAVTPTEPPKRNWWPSRKWAAAQVTLLLPIAYSAIDTGWDGTESKLLAGVIAQALISYWVPNKDS